MKILVLLSRVPWPLEKGDKLRAYHQLRQLSKRHTLVVFAISHHSVHPHALRELHQFCNKVYISKITWRSAIWNIFTCWIKKLPGQIGYFYSRKSADRLKKIYHDEKPDHVYCQLTRMGEYARLLTGPMTIDYQDVFSEGIRRRMEKSSWWFKPFLKAEYKRMVSYEAALFDRFDGHTIISDADRQLIKHTGKEDIQVIENGVDTDFFHEIETEKQYDLVFTGNMNYPPNVLAAEYLVQKILPQCRQIGINPRVLLAGATPNPRVKALASDQITVSGWIDDIRISYASSRIFIAPMQIGTGLQNKLLEAMSMRIPCITSPLANSSLKANPAEEILVGNAPGEYALHIKFLLDNPEQARMMATNGQRFVKKHFNWEASADRLEKVFEAAQAKYQDSDGRA